MASFGTTMVITIILGLAIFVSQISGSDDCNEICAYEKNMWDASYHSCSYVFRQNRGFTVINKKEENEQISNAEIKHNNYTVDYFVQVIRANLDLPRYVYRVLRKDENPKNGIMAKDTTGDKSVQSHVGCGCRPNYKSQYVSTTADEEVAKKYAQKTNNRYVRINVRVAMQSRVQITDLREGGPLKGVARNFAIASKELLLYGATIPAKAVTLVYSPC